MLLWFLFTTQVDRVNQGYKYHLKVKPNLQIQVKSANTACNWSRALEAVWRVVAAANGYIDAQAPWTLKKENPNRMKTVLYILSEVIRCLAIIVQPVTPNSSAKILDQLTIPDNEREFSFISSNFALKPGTKIEKPKGVFPRIQLEEEAT